MTQIKVFTRYLEIIKPLIGLRISLLSIIDTSFLPKCIITAHKNPNVFLIRLELDNNQRPNSYFAFYEDMI